MKSFFTSVVCGLTVYGISSNGNASTFSLRHCRAIEPELARLACYDQISLDEALPESNTLPDFSPPPAKTTALFELQPLAYPQVTASYMSKLWELDPAEEDRTFTFKSYKPMYLLPFYYQTSVNTQPFNSGVDQGLQGDLQKTESKFQLSFKTKVIKSLLNGQGDLWLGYTQQSFWQVYNRQNSAPFRETNYEPEAMLVLKTDYDVMGWRARMLNLGLVHQSNGRGSDLSRSWNRLYLQFGLEKGDYSLFIKPWWRIPESVSRDDNPGIERYMGRAEVLGIYRHQGYSYSLLWRNNLSAAENRGSWQFSWAFPVQNKLKGYLQIFNGYGANLLDYRFHQTSIGVGIVVSE